MGRQGLEACKNAGILPGSVDVGARPSPTDLPDTSGRCQTPTQTGHSAPGVATRAGVAERLAADVAAMLAAGDHAAAAALAAALAAMLGAPSGPPAPVVDLTAERARGR